MLKRYTYRRKKLFGAHIGRRQHYEARWRQMAALSGIVYAVLLFLGNILARAGSRQEPAVDADAVEIAYFFATRYRPESQIGIYLASVAFFFFPWFLGALWWILRRSEGGNIWASTTALGGGLTAGVLHLAGQSFWAAAAITSNSQEGIHVQVARISFTLGNTLLANSWLLYAVLLAATAASSIRTNALPSLLGWSSAVLAVLLLIARALWPSVIGHVVFFFFLPWVVLTSMVLATKTEGSS